MSKVSISLAEKKLLEHLRRGGSSMDPVGRELVKRFIAKASQDGEVRQVISDQQATLEELAIMYATVIGELMPNPCIQAGGPLLVPTLFFMEPHRLRDLLIGVNRDTRGSSLVERMELFVGRAVELAHITQEAHDSARGPIDFRITAAGGLKSARAGCTGVLVLLFLAGVLALALPK